MSTSCYYGHAAGAVVRWRGDKVMSLVVGSVDRRPPEGADWTLRFSPRGAVAKARPLALRLYSLSIARHRGELSAPQYLDAIDCAIVDADTRPEVAP